jgi:diguanylate cyclase (GGDEF)-like protein
MTKTQITAITRDVTEIEADAMFDLAPISLWVEDYTGVRTRFAEWRAQGVEDLRAFLVEDRDRVRQCASLIRIVRVNRRTLDLFEAPDLVRLIAGLEIVFHGDMFESHVDELVQLWEGANRFTSRTVNYTLSGRRLDIMLSGRILPGSEEDWARVLVAVEDITELETARRALGESDRYARGLFDHSPVSLWVEDFSAIHRLIGDVRACGIEDFRTFTDVHPEFVERCMSEIRVVDVNRETLRLFGAADRTELLLRSHEIFRDAMIQPFREQLIDLWDGKTLQHREVVNYALDGEELHLLMQFSVLPGHESDWSLVQVALTDITARKKAEVYLEFLGKHDVLTKLFNRSFWVDEINRLERAGIIPVTVVIADLNGLKHVNDTTGHAAGDQLLRRAGEILSAAVSGGMRAARIGGDEFAVLMPGADERAGEMMMENIRRLVDLNNQFYGGAPLSFAMGAATRQPGERLESVAGRADALMYKEKRAHHARLGD